MDAARIVIATLILSFFAPLSAHADAKSECEAMKPKVAPAVAAMMKCQKTSCEPGQSVFSPSCAPKCRSEVKSYVDVASEGLEKCGPVDPTMACREFGEVIHFCDSEQSCAKGKKAFESYCAKAGPSNVKKEPGDEVRPDAW